MTLKLCMLYNMAVAWLPVKMGARFTCITAGLKLAVWELICERNFCSYTNESCTKVAENNYPSVFAK